MKIAIYPGTFDPPTKGHEDIAHRALQVFDKVIIAVGDNRAKNVLFSAKERVELWEGIIKDSPDLKDSNRVEVMSFSGLVVDFAKKQKANIIVRGLRAISDFEYELQIAETNRSLWADIDTVFFTAKGRQLFVSSTTVKEVASHGGDISHKAPKNVCEALQKKFSQNKI